MTRLTNPQLRALAKARDCARAGGCACVHRREVHSRTFDALVRLGMLTADTWGWGWLTREGWLKIVHGTQEAA